jgi:hypothetical protein
MEKGIEQKERRKQLSGMNEGDNELKFKRKNS